MAQLAETFEQKEKIDLPKALKDLNVKPKKIEEVVNLLDSGRPVPFEHMNTGTKRKAGNPNQVLSLFKQGYVLDI